MNRGAPRPAGHTPGPESALSPEVQQIESAQARPRSTTPPLRLRPTAALNRAVIGGVVLMLAALLMGRPPLMLLGAPLLVWAVLAMTRRAARQQDQEIPGPVIRSGERTITEDSTVRVDAVTEPDLLIAATIPLPRRTDTDPLRGSTLGEGTAHFRLTPHRWGRIEVGPLHMQIGDPFGAFRAQRRLRALSLQVVPTASVLEATTTLSHPIGISGFHLSSRRGDGTALADVREFRAGDRLARINWRVTNRTGRLHTNSTFTEQDTDVLIVTDTTTDVQPSRWAPDDAPSSLDLTIRATTAIARHYLSVGDRVAVHDLGHLIGPVRPGTGPRQMRVLIDVLSRADRSVADNRPMRRVATVRSGTLAVVCSPLLTDQAVGQIGSLRSLGADVVVIDTLPPSLGALEDLERARRAQRGRDRRAAEYWAEAWTIRRLQRERTLRELREAGVPVTAWEGPVSLAPVLLSLARMGSAPRMRRA